MPAATRRSRTKAAEALVPEWNRRAWIENVEPSVDGGRHPVKRTVGEKVSVAADVFADGHDQLKAVVRYRHAEQRDWQEAPMEQGASDRWWGSFPVECLGSHHYTVEAWIDRFGSWRHELEKKVGAGLEVVSELLEGAELVKEAAGRASGPDKAWLETQAAALADTATSEPERIELALAPELTTMAGRYPDRSASTAADAVLDVVAVRERARVGAWYEAFPRSYGPDPETSGSLRDAERDLPRIAKMGFDVLYLPPIHPIGYTARKGPNNTVLATPESPGSPWAIGSEDGGHTAIHPQLGTEEDFAHFLDAARRQGLEVALDLAFQCSPDHPYVREHPEWFRHRPDGTIKYAENPPKKYQDIYPLDFECRQWWALWQELKRVVFHWLDAGVRIFRVDNPHTKPIRFWEWLIREVREPFPETVFLSEAFTRPKVMYALAKVGFDQSYTYFTWRNTKPELIGYLTELTSAPVRDFFRPNFFANTPDILPEYLQYGGRAAFQIRFVLAATLAASYGIYSGFENCENEAVPGTEEYADSEKYELRPRNWDRRESIRPLITKVNAIRRENPALWSNARLRFHSVSNDQLLFYSKSTPDSSNIVLVVVNLDPHHTHDGWVEVPLREFGLQPDEIYQVHDLIGEGRYLWQGAHNYVRLDPSRMPAQVFRMRKRMRSERDFDYFM